MSVRRCTRCERLYSDGEDGQCRYHPGQHYRLGWTCCRDPSFSAPGCRFGSHVEDLNMTRALDEVLASAQPVCPPAAPLDSASRDSDSDSTSGPEPVIVFEDPSGTMSVASVACGGEEPAATPPSPHCLESVQAAPAAAAADGDDEEEANEERRGWFLVPYLVGPHDSFNAVCMRHRMAPEELSRVNSLRHRSLRPGSTVLVWAERSETEVREAERATTLLCFRRQHSCSVGEARYYLELHEYDVERAIQQRRDDLDWEERRGREADVDAPLSPATEQLSVPPPLGANLERRNRRLAVTEETRAKIARLVAQRDKQAISPVKRCMKRCVVAD
mmetsp:Transcript_22508/g.66297  ORF Transcript_22508/g.66297 Transcript_22508/m.66297 type:complete len:332 (-) Transcript_22508:414-1409(-)